MKTRHYFRFHVLLSIVTAMTLLTACSDIEDNPAVHNPIGDKIVGKWYIETPKQVTLGTGENAVECAKVVLVGTFDADGEGFWSYILVDKQNRAIQPVGKDGKEHPYYANCNYSVTGNNVDVELTANYLPTSQMEWTFNYNGTCLQTKYEDRMIDLHPITTGEDAMFQEWMQQLGFGASADNYNINDKDITAENWRQTEAIYIYDGVGADVTDEKGRTGYTTVNLPWYQGDKETNLPEGFCDDITPEMGWEWVLNRCGSRSIVSNNFFAVYNKYTGILRFFYYMPQSTNTGNDHVWQVSMTDNLATHTTIPYGVPNDRTITNKAAITQDASGTFMDYVTPWVDYRSDDGLIVPNAGWWAFDVDLSLTRPETLSADDNIKLQMRSWNTNHTSLYSTVLANIDGEMKGSFEGQTKTPLIASSSKGLFGRVGDFVKLGTKVKDAVTNLYSGNVVGAIKGGIDLAKTGSSLASGKTKASGGETSGTFDGTFDGTINMMMNGTINTDGVIKGSAPTVGVASPTFYLKDFDTKNSLLGQGVWNIKATPKVYYMSKPISSYLKEFYKDDEPYWTESRAGKDWLVDISRWMFFDPSSVEVELNPKVFPESEIEWMQVDAIAGARKEIERTGTDPARIALGLSPLTESTKKEEIESDHYEPEAVNYLFNFVGTGDFEGEKLGYEFPKRFEYGETDFEIKYNDPKYDVKQSLFCFGAGNDDYIIEPQMSCWRDGTLNWIWDQYGSGYLMPYGERAYSAVGDGKTTIMHLKNVPFYFPPTEINVTVMVKLKSLDAPIVLNRLYLPQFESVDLDASKAGEIMDRINAKKNLSPKTAGHTQSYDFQAARINKCFKLLSVNSLAPLSLDISTFAAENKRWTTWYNDQYTYVIITEVADAYTAEYNAEKSCMILHKLGKVVPKGMSVVIVADADDVPSVRINRDNNAAAPQNIPNNSLNGANTVSPVSDIITTLKGRVDGANGGTVYVLRQGDNGFGYYPYTDTNMTEHTSFLFIADVQYPGGAQPAFVSVAFE